MTLQADLERGRYDVPFFADRFLGIKLHPGQVRLTDAYIKRDPTRWRPAFLTIAVAAGNRAGKTLALVVVIIHSCVYKTGVRPPADDTDREVVRWSQAPYLAFHFAIQQEIAELVFNEINMILHGVHPAQGGRGCGLADELGGPAFVATTDLKYNSAYRWVKFAEPLGGAEVHFRTTAEKALGSLGRDMHFISYDEAGLDPHLDFVLAEVLHLRRLGTGGQLVIISTPSEDVGPMFADEWEKGNPDNPGRGSRRFSLRISTRDNIGFGIDAENFAAMVADYMDNQALIDQNIDGLFIQGKAAYFDGISIDRSFIDDLPETEMAQHGHVYIHGIDPGLMDRCWSLVFDYRRVPATDEIRLTGVKAEFSTSRTTESVIALAANNHFAYDVKTQRLRSSCNTGMDTTALGGHMFRDLLEQSVPFVLPIEFGGSIQKKRKLVGDLKTMFDKGRIRMPRTGPWLRVRKQLLGYKLNDRKIEQDAVMCLAVVVAIARRQPAGPDDAPMGFDFYAIDAPDGKRPFNWRKPRQPRKASVS